MQYSSCRESAGILALCASATFAQGSPHGLQDCAAIADDRARLACFDALAAGSGAPKDEEPVRTRQEAAVAPVTATSEPVEPEPAEHGPDSGTSYLARHWELQPESKQGTFRFRPHHDNYFIATYNASPNNAPYRPFRTIAPEAGNLNNAELAFQLGFKIKVLENPMEQPVDLWLGYTQRSFWQAANQEASSPFRETDYQPELMAVIPVDFHLLGLRARFLNVGFAHQSNGQTSTLSRSWNRVYAQIGLEREGFTLLARVWKRINENRREDDNPDITDYMGRGDVMASYRWQGHEFSALARYNFHTDKGGAELGWAFPLAPRLKGYVQYFSGYGHTLIDYNYYQRVLGLGFLVVF